MFEPSILDYTLKAMILVLMLSLPPIIVAAVTGILVAMFQAVTQIQEQTLAFAVKLVAVIITIIITAGWSGGEILNFTMILFDTFAVVGQ